MTPENFCYWLQGYFELTESKFFSQLQAKIVKDHLELVFSKVTPDRPTWDDGSSGSGYSGFCGVSGWMPSGVDIWPTGISCGLPEYTGVSC